jgi:hypothetical protein
MLSPTAAPIVRRTLVTLLSLAALGADAPRAAAQGIMGRIKSKAVEAAANAAAKKAAEPQPAAAAAPAATPATAPNAAAGAAALPSAAATPAGPAPLAGRNLVMTTAVVDRLMIALAANTRITAYGAGILAKPAVTSEQRRACVQGFAKDPAFHALAARQAAQRWELSYRELQDSVVDERCGTDYPSGYASRLARHAEAVAMGTSGLDYAQYATLKERAVPFCDALVNGHAKKLRIPYLGNGGGGPHAFYVYTAEEADAIAPHCTEILQSLRKTNG